MTHKHFLIVETPRGGPFGHRFIMPPESSLAHEEVELLFQKASQGHMDGFLAVQHMVEQHLPNGSIREGPETLLLTGIKASALEQYQIKTVTDILCQKLVELDRLVTRTINWEEVGNSTIIVRRELLDWWENDLSPALPASTEEKKKSSSASYSGLIMGIIFGVVIGCIALYIIFK